MTEAETATNEALPARANALGVRARLLLAFCAISAFAILAAAAGIYAFREVGARLATVDTRVPPALRSLELSRSAERIIAAAPALLAAADRAGHDKVSAALDAEAAHLNETLRDLKGEPTEDGPIAKIEPTVAALTAKLGTLRERVALRLETTERVRALRGELFRTNDETQRLLAPWLEVLARQISSLAAGLPGAGAARDEDARQLAALIELQRATRLAQAEFAGVVDMLNEVSATEQDQRLPILAFQIGLALRDLDRATAGLDARLRPLFLEQVAKLQAIAAGPNAVTDIRGRELALIADGRVLLADTGRLSAQLTAAVDELGVAAKQDIGTAIRDAVSVQRLSTRTLLVLVGLSLLTILIVGVYVGRRIVRRLTALSDRTLAIAGGRAGTPVAIEGTDEIAAMGRALEVFRRNALERDELLAEKARAAERLEDEVRQRTRELREALEQQAATAEILRVISTSPTDSQPVFDTIVRSAVLLCGSRFANVFRFDGERLHFAASHNVGPDYLDLLRSKYPMPPDPSQVSGRVVLTKSVVRLEDALADPDYDQRFPRALGWRRMLGVPMLREGWVVGVLVVGWAEPGPVLKADEDLLTAFADQAVIAIENARLFDEVQARTRELSEALQQQTATADVLKAISRSTFDLQTVLDTLCEAAARLCAADHAWLFRREGDVYRWAASYGHSLEDHERIREFMQAQRIVPGSGTLVGRTALEQQPVLIPDALVDSAYKWSEAIKVGKYRTTFGTPLLRAGESIGVLALTRSDVRPFTDRQIELATIFADQAVIAIENARLFDEVQARTREVAKAFEQQTATAEILRVISTSPTDAQPVFEAIVRNAVFLCGSLFANVFRFDGERLHFVASHNVGPDYVELLRAKYPMRPDASQVSGRVLLTKSVVRLEDALTDPEYDQRFPRALGWRRMLGVPMQRQGAPLGVVVVGWAEPGPIPKDQEELLTTFADQAVIAIENARLFDEIQDKTRQLENANKYKSHFLASASHDLRQPLHALNLFVALLQSERDPAERARLIGRVNAAVGSMNELFESLLDMSKLEAGVLEASVGGFPVQRLLDRVEATFADAAREKGLHFAIVRSGAWVRSDFILLERVLLNLVSNAIRYTERGGVVVGCRRRGSTLRVDVCDSGPGIPPEQQPLVFQEYVQLRGPGPERRSGLGLGLAIVDRLCRLLGHPLELDSRPGRGSRFSVMVPATAPAQAEPESVLPTAAADPVRGALVLVIDDDPLVREGMGGILQSWNCEVLAVRDENEALAALARQGRMPDVVVSDYRLEGDRTGIEAIDRLRAKFGRPIPAFLISGDTAPDRLRVASERGLHLLHKPVPPMRLRLVLSQLLRERAAETARARATRGRAPARDPAHSPP